MMFSGIVEVSCFDWFSLQTFLSLSKASITWPLLINHHFYQEIGSIELLKTNPKMVQWDGSIGEGVELTVKSKVALGDAYIGCSIAVNGVCLTAISFDTESVRT